MGFNLQSLLLGSSPPSTDSSTLEGKVDESTQSYEDLITGLTKRGYGVATADGETPAFNEKLPPDFVNTLVKTHPRDGVLVRYFKGDNSRRGYYMFPLWAFYEPRSLETVLSDRPYGVMIVDLRRGLQTVLLRQRLFPFDVFLDGKVQHAGSLAYTGQRELSIKMLPEIGREHTEFSALGLTLFEIPLSDLPLVEGKLGNEKYGDQLRQACDKEVDMGDYQHLRVYNLGFATVPLTYGHVYDVLVMGRRSDGGRKAIIHGRVVAHEKQLGPFLPTPEEMKYLAMESLGLSLEEANGVRAQVKYIGTFSQLPTGFGFWTHGLEFMYLAPDGSVSPALSSVWHTTDVDRFKRYTPLKEGVGHATLQEVRSLIGK